MQVGELFVTHHHRRFRHQASPPLRLGERDDVTQSPFSKVISEALRKDINAAVGAQAGDVVLFQFGRPKLVNSVLGGLRLMLGKKLALIDLNNLRIQCYSCNINKSGNWLAYENRLLKENGEDFVKELKARNELTKGKMYREDWYELQIKKYESILESINGLS